MPNNAPLFIIGSERSGTTLLMVMLGAHPRIAVPEVTWYYPRFRAYLHTYGDLSNPKNFRTLAEEAIHGLKTPYFGLTVNPRTVVDEILARVKTQTFSALFDGIIGWYADAQKKPRWGEKTPHNLYYVKEILEDFPYAQFIHLTRDGRDVAVEQLESSFGPTNAYAAATIWKRTVQTAAAARKIVPSAQWLDISYEDLAREPEAVLRRVTTFLKEEYDPRVLNFHRDEIAQRRAKTKDHSALGEPANAKHIGKYKELLSRRDQQNFVGVAGAELRATGYEVDVPPLTLTPAQIALYEEWDVRVRAATLDAPHGHIVYESYNDWLADRREERRRAGIWTRAEAAPVSTDPRREWDEEFISGQRAPRYWKNAFGIKRQYSQAEIVL